MPHRGIYLSSFPEVMQHAIQVILAYLYRDFPTRPRTRSKQDRNDEIRKRYQVGESLAQLAQSFNISFQRVQQIIKERHR